ncbi:MAG TPA: adenylate/guanylate cyclase domain-containing protein [Xanthobacteraceae bacterium]|nr:adenylate/guanylate cyclase domain-containing protein [Xanthobacteraceae bacterium]
MLGNLAVGEQAKVTMTETNASKAEDERLHRVLLAYVRQEFEAPVAAILGYTEIMLEDAERSGARALVDDLQRVRKAGLTLKELVSNALHLPQSEGDFADFRRNLRHDLRTPLTAIKGFGEMLLEDALECRNEALANDLQKLLDAGSRLLTQIDSIISFTGLPEQRSAEATPEKHAVSAIIRSVRPVSSAAQETATPSRILIVDDTQATRELLCRRLARDGHHVVEAGNGHSALHLTATEPFDLVLLDMMMPDISGYDVLTQLKADSRRRHIPVIVISALDQIDSIARCIEAGAEDYLSKPFDPVLLRARIGASLDKKRLRDREQAATAELRAEKERSEAILLNILPKSIIARMNNGETTIADDFRDVTVLFSDIVGFTRMSMRRSASEVVAILNGIFSAVDRVALDLGIEKIKTIGDAYMAVAGLPEPRIDHAEVIAKLALSMRNLVSEVSRHYGEDLKVRIGIHTGETVAGVIGTHKFAYDVWGDTVNTASAMESHGIPNEIQVSKASFSRLSDHFILEARGLVDIKGKGRMETFLLRGERTRAN